MNQIVDIDGEPLKVSKDEFFRGSFCAIQPIGKGHRSGSDALLIAAGLPKEAKGQLIDLGSGTGVAGLAAICQNDQLSVQLVEKNKMMFELAGQTLSLPENVELLKRAELLNADATLSGTARTEAGLQNNFADYVIMNPPYNSHELRASPDSLKAEAHVMDNSGLDAWMRTSAAVLKPGGTLILIYRTEKLGEIIACSQGRFGELSIVPVHSRVGENAKRLIVKMKKGAKAPLSVMPGITMHDEEGGPTELNQALMNGHARVEFLNQ